MNILLIYGNLVTLAGSENSVLLLAKGLKGLGNRVFFLSGKLEKNKHLADEAFQEKIECPSFFLERPFWAPSTLKTELKNLDAFIQKNNIEVLHIHCPIRNEAFRALNKKYKVVFTAHVAVCPTKSRYLWTQERPCTKKVGVSCVTFGYFGNNCCYTGNGAKYSLPGFLKALFKNLSLWKNLAKTKKIIAPSKWMKSQLISDGLNASMIEVINSPIDPLYFQNTAPIEKSDPHEIRIIFIGRLVKSKGPKHLLLASSKITAPHSVHILGDGPELENLKLLAQSLKIAERVHFHGYVESDETSRLLKQADILAFTSLWPENFSLVGIEAMASGVPAVGYDVGGNAEWLQSYKTGILVKELNPEDFRNALLELIENPDKRKEYSLNARKMAPQFSAKIHCEKIASLYKEVRG